jgi:hypothetical protein
LSTNTKHEVVYINLDDAVTVTRNDVAERGGGIDSTVWFEPVAYFESEQDWTVLTQVPPGVRNAHASVRKKTQASLDDRNQTSDQKIDVWRFGREGRGRSKSWSNSWTTARRNTIARAVGPTMSMNSHQALDRAEALFKKKEERLREGQEAMAEYEADGDAMREKTARLRALRLARDAANNQAPILPARKRSALLPARKRSALGEWFHLAPMAVPRLCCRLIVGVKRWEDGLRLLVVCRLLLKVEAACGPARAVRDKSL